MLLGVDFCLAVGEFVASFVDLLQRSLICPHFQQIVLGIGRVDLGLQVFGLLLAVAGVAATELGTQGTAQRVQVSGLGRQGEQAEQKGGRASVEMRMKTSMFDCLRAYPSRAGAVQYPNKVKGPRGRGF